jgi:peptidoglycan/xylan/chitin deacetylase (PgdA/CDA1 family)
LRPLILCYHAISDSWDDQLAISPSAFARQIRTLLQRGYRAITAAEAVRGTRRSFHVTFDDAFRGVLTVAPLLQLLNVPATVFACPAFADVGRPLDVPELVRSSRLDLEEGRTMNWTELRTLAQHGIEVGSHTLTHRHLTHLSATALERELRESRERLQHELGRPCRHLAYPYGEHDERVRAAAERVGYEAAFALDEEAHPGDPFSVPRIGIWRTDGFVRLTLKTMPGVSRGVRRLRRLTARR